MCIVAEAKCVGVFAGDTLGERRVAAYDARAKLGLTYRDATRRGPPIAYGDEQHRQGPGVQWRDSNMGHPAAMDERRVR